VIRNYGEFVEDEEVGRRWVCYEEAFGRVLKGVNWLGVREFVGLGLVGKSWRETKLELSDVSRLFEESK
jgi:hypothetical protein